MILRAVDVPAEIVTAMGGAPPTEEQWRAITMPLEPSALIAGAGGVAGTASGWGRGGSRVGRPATRTRGPGRSGPGLVAP